MATPFLGQIKVFSFDYPPKGWTFCDGQLLPINQNQALFSLLGTTFGGNGQTNFALPDLRGRMPIHFGQGAGLSPRVLGEVGGSSAVTLTIAQTGPHTHTVPAVAGPGTVSNPVSGVPAKEASGQTAIYSASAADTTMAPQTIGNTGGGQAHNNMQPYLGLRFCIALQGIFPSRS